MKKQNEDLAVYEDVVIYGEIFNTEELLDKEAELFCAYLKQDRDENKKPHNLLWEFAQARNWAGMKKTEGTSIALDLKAVSFRYPRFFYGPGYLKEVQDTPEGELERRRRNYEKYLKDNGLMGRPATKEELKEIDTASEERDKYLPTRILNNQEYKEWITNFKRINDKYFMAWGLRPCKASDCIRPIPPESRENKIYCSNSCKNKEKGRRRRATHPKEDLKSKLKYLKGSEEEGYLD